MNNHTIRRMLEKTFLRQWRFNGQKVFKCFLKNTAATAGTLVDWSNRGCFKCLLLEEPRSSSGDRHVAIYMLATDFDKFVNLSTSDSSFDVLINSSSAMFVDMSNGRGYLSAAVSSGNTSIYYLNSAASRIQDGLVKITVRPPSTVGLSITGVSSIMMDGCDLQLAPAQAAPTATGTGMVLFAGGAVDNITYYQEIIRYTIASSNSASAFGRLMDQSSAGAGTGQTGGRGLFIGGRYPLFRDDYANHRGLIEDINYITFSTTSNTSFFSELVSRMDYMVALTNCDRVCVVGGAVEGAYQDKIVSVNNMQYTSINTPVRCSIFATITGVKQAAGVSNGKNNIGIYAGGRYAPVDSDPFVVVDYAVTDINRVTINTNNTASSVSNLSTAKYNSCMVSNGIGDIAVLVGGQNDSVTITDMEYMTISTGVNMTAFGTCTSGASVGASNGSGNKAVFKQNGQIYTININTPMNATSFASSALEAQYSMCNQDKVD